MDILHNSADPFTGRNNGWPIKKGYVAFGDSFAAGMGTGNTSEDSCRIGTANVGDLLVAHTNDLTIDYQRKMCSGDTTTGFNRQIDEWTRSELADIATVTMSGNEVGFSDIVLNCILVPWSWPFAPDYSAECDKAKATARSRMQDKSDSGIGPKLASAYKKILAKSTRKVSATKSG